MTSGWALGQQYLDGTTAVAEAKAGEGKVYLMGPEVAFRGEPHATFKLLFNAVLLGNAELDPGGAALSGEFPGVAEQVLKQDAQ